MTEVRGTPKEVRAHKKVHLEGGVEFATISLVVMPDGDLRGGISFHGNRLKKSEIADEKCAECLAAARLFAAAAPQLLAKAQLLPHLEELLTSIAEVVETISGEEKQAEEEDEFPDTIGGD